MSEAAIANQPGWYVGRRGHIAHYAPEGAGVYWRTACGKRLLHSGMRITVPMGDPSTSGVCARCHQSVSGKEVQS